MVSKRSGEDHSVLLGQDIDQKVFDVLCRWMDSFFASESVVQSVPVFVAVSGGADSMALAHVLWRWCSVNNRPFLVMTVDHGLREEAKKEAAHVRDVLSAWDHKIEHRILHWEHEGGKPLSRLQEEARGARYALMAQEMQKYCGVYLFTAHHLGDQAETFLFRLAKGSGLDGLAGMSDMQLFENGLRICRPLLSLSKSDLIAYCEFYSIAYCHDQSNDSERFARVRLRHSMDVLGKEGLTEKRLAHTAYRIGRARRALDEISSDVYNRCLENFDHDRIVFDFNVLKYNPEEIVLRVVIKAIDSLSDSQGYGVRLEKIENLVVDLLKPLPFRKRTLGKLVFCRNDMQGIFEVLREQGAK